MVDLCSLMENYVDVKIGKEYNGEIGICRKRKVVERFWNSGR